MDKTLSVSLHTRMQELALPAGLVGLLTNLAHEDVAHLTQHGHLAQLFPTLRQVFPDDSAALDVLQQAWFLMYTAIRRLDALQDHDPTDHVWPVDANPGTRYHLVVALYVLAASLLDDLPETVPPARRLQLQRVWNDTMLRMADGQYGDLCAATMTTPLPLDAYQQIAQAKTGATFALAFGAAALVSQDDPAVVAVLTLYGELYGTLIQYSDDLHDAATQPWTAATLPVAIAAHPHMQTAADRDATLQTFWTHVYTHYRQAMLTTLDSLAPPMRAPLIALWRQVFEHPAKE